MTHKEWIEEGERRFGQDAALWQFVCPVCKHVASVADYRAAGAPETAIGFSCIGRWIEGSKPAFEKSGKGPCTYAGGGLFKLNPVEVIDPAGRAHTMFAFAGAEVDGSVRDDTGFSPSVGGMPD